MSRRTLVLLHGVGGPDEPAPVLDLLNDHLGARGYEVVEPPEVLVLDYDAILSGEEKSGTRLAETWHRPGDDVLRRARAAYVARASAIRARLDRTEESFGSAWTAAPSVIGDLAMQAPPLKQAHRYASSADVRWAVRREILARMPGEGEVVLVGHSLGTVIAVDLIPHLPAAVVVRALVTLASPLGFVPRLRAHSELMRRSDDYPFDRVQSWTNLYSPNDPVTGGRGVAAHYPWATDASIDAGSHGLRDHLNHPATQEVLEEALYGTYLPAPRPQAVERPLADAWIPQLLTFAWSQRLGEAYAGKDQDLRRRLRGARAELARRSVEQYRQQLDALDEATASAGEVDAATRDRLSDLHVAPTQAELLDRAGDLLVGRLDDRSLVSMIVPVVRSWPASPFQVADRPSWEQRQRALEMLLARVRRRGQGRLDESDTDLARVVIEHIRKAQKDMGNERSGAGPWWALAGVGALALIAAPLTMGASIPAGLSGAAALTAGLAAFGPGGMAGGIATIAALTGAGAMAAGAGAGMARAEEEDYDRRRRTQQMARDAQQFRQRVMEMPAPNLREMLANVLAVVRLDEQLGGDPVSIHYPEAQRHADRIRSEGRLHREFAPGSDTTRDWEKRLKVIERYAEQLRPSVVSDARALERSLDELKAGDSV